MSRKFKIRTTEGKVREIAVPEKPRVSLGGKSRPREAKPTPKPAPNPAPVEDTDDGQHQR